MGSKSQFTECAKLVKDFLADEPFRLFEQSMYFHRYLQWKWLERLVGNDFDIAIFYLKKTIFHHIAFLLLTS